VVDVNVKSLIHGSLNHHCALWTRGERAQ
jgi:hypothetical protein